jgi:biopolymer transport protein ExbB
VFRPDRVFEDGGYLMYAILVLHAATVGLFLWRARVLIGARWGSRYVATEVVEELRRSGRAEEALRLRGLARTPIGRVLFVGLMAANKTVEHVVATMKAARVREVAMLDRGSSYLGLFASMSILVGLLGTIVGLCKPWPSAASSDATSRAAALAAGISESMWCTTFGLYTSAVAVAALGFVRAQRTYAVADLDAGVAQLVATLTEMRRWIRLYDTRPVLESPSYRD